MKKRITIEWEADRITLKCWKKMLLDDIGIFESSNTKEFKIKIEDLKDE